MADQRAALEAITREYDAQGWHRTGTAVDAESARWLADRAAALGATPSREPFALSRVDPLPAFVELDGRRVEGTPLFDAPFTDVTGVEGRLGPLGSEAELGYLAAPPAPERREPLHSARRAAGHRAIVVATVGELPGLALLNAPDFLRPFGPPVLQVPSEAAALLAERAERRAPARIVCPAERRPAQADNLVLNLPGREAGLAPVVVMTPRSGWWQCASERAGGLACWLEALGAVGSADRRRPVHFIATSGHELGHLGLATFLAGRPSLARSAFAWVHLGANLGARGGSLRPTASDEPLRAAAEAAFGHLEPAALVSATVEPRGESREIHARGGRFVSLVGSNPRFHLPGDRWPEAVDLDQLARHAAATAALVLRLSEA